ELLRKHQTCVPAYRQVPTYRRWPYWIAFGAAIIVALKRSPKVRFVAKSGREQSHRRDLSCYTQSTDRSPNMPDNIRFSNPDTMQKPPGYSHVVEVTGPGRTVYFAGQLGIDKSGKMGANAREQIEIAFENVKAALASVGASFENVVKLN